MASGQTWTKIGNEQGMLGTDQLLSTDLIVAIPPNRPEKNVLPH